MIFGADLDVTLVTLPRPQAPLHFVGKGRENRAERTQPRGRGSWLHTRAHQYGGKMLKKERGIRGNTTVTPR